MLKQAQAMQQKMREQQEALSCKEYSGKAGGSLVELVINGEGKLLKIKIDASLLKNEEKEILEDLIIAAHNDAKSRMDEDSKNSMNDALGGMNIPANFKMPM